ncbi:hypothetical protein VPH35_028601 [Triticum aestivum]
MAPAPLHSSHGSFFYYCVCVCVQSTGPLLCFRSRATFRCSSSNQPPAALSSPIHGSRAGSGFFPRASYSSHTDRESLRCATPIVVLPTSPPSLLHQQGVGHRICLPPICSSFVSFLQLAEHYFEVQ